MLDQKDFALTIIVCIESSLCLINSVSDGSKSSLTPITIRTLVDVLYPAFCSSINE